MKITKKSIVLVGMPGSGKSSLGKAIAKKLNRNYYDLDKEIEKDLNLSINLVFKSLGEKFFREKEYETLKKIISNTDTLISSGGGTFCHAKCFDLIKTFGLSVWVDTNIDVIFKRLNGKKNRPLLKGLKDKSLNEKLIEMYFERSKYYIKADIRLKVSDMSLSDSISKIIDKFKKVNQGLEFE